MRHTAILFLIATFMAGPWACPTTEPEDDDDDAADDDAADDDTGDDDVGDDDMGDDDVGDDDSSEADDDVGDDDVGDDDVGDDDTGDDDTTPPPAYTVTTSSCSWSSIAGTGSDLPNPMGSVTIPFDVSFFGTTYSSGASLNVHELGVVGFSSMTALVPGDAAHYDSAGVTPCVAAHHHSSLDASMYSQVSGSAPNRTLILEWNGTYMLEFGHVEVQLRFAEGSDDFEICYGNMEADAFDPNGWSQLAAEDGTSFHETYVKYQTAVDPGTLDNTTWTYDWP